MNNQNQSNNNDNEFASLLEQSLMKRDNFTIGECVEGKVVYITPDQVFVDISGKSEAVMDASEFKDDNGKMGISTGDTITAYIASMSRGEIIMTLKVGRGVVDTALLQTAYSENLPVEGTVVRHGNGGYTVSVSGIDCFCPHSQIDLRPVHDSESMLNKTFSFKIIQFTKRGRNIVLSRRSLLEEIQTLREEELKKSLSEGDVVTGNVSSIQKFGILVDLDGVEALVPRTEISWSRRPEMDSFKPGDTVEARVVSIEWKNKRIVLSIKQMSPEPWSHIDRYSAGQDINGTISNIIKNGAFVELEPGIEGFIPISRMSPVRRVNKPEDVVSIGDEVSVRILELRPEDRKMSLELITSEPDPWQESTDSLNNTVFTATVESVKSSGISVRLSNGMFGFLPREECAVKKGTDLQTVYTAGSDIKVIILTIDKKNKRLRLSETGALKMEERRDFEKYMKDQNQPQESGTPFGRLFKQKYEEIQRKQKD